MNRSTHKLHFLEDQQDAPAWDTLRTVLEQTRPVQIYTSLGSDSSFQKALDKVVNKTKADEAASGASTDLTAERDDDDGPDAVERIEWLVPQEFMPERGRMRLRELRVIEGKGYDPMWGVEPKKEDEGEAQNGRPVAPGAGRADDQDDSRAKPFTSMLEGSPLTVNRLPGQVLIGLTDADSDLVQLGCAGVLIDKMAHKARQAPGAFKVAGLELLKLCVQRWVLISNWIDADILGLCFSDEVMVVDFESLV